MSNFALDVNTSNQELISSINYLLSTVGSGITANALVANTTTGTITNVTSGNIIAYLYQWINIRYADTADGGTNFSTSPTNRLYYGVRNSTTSTASSNPADYIWFEVAAGGFGTTKFLFYSSIGGNQIQFFVGTTAPNLFYEQTVDNTPIDLSVITTSIPTTTVNIFYPEGQFIVRGNNNVYTPPAVANVVTLVANVQALRQNQITAAVDQNIQYFTANGNYFITSNTSTAFNSNLFTFSSPYSSTYNVYQDVVYSDITGTITSFLSAALIVNDAAANVGPPGQRGSIPLGFVTTVNDPNTATTANLTTQFEAPRTNTTPPIGLGVGPPISGDTVQFFFPNLTAINGGITSVRTYDGNVWIPVTANVISGNVIYTGTITSQAMSTSDIFTLRIESTNSELGNINAKGFWLDSISGDARFAGNTYVGNNLVIGNNAVIGGNLGVAGLITAGALNANVVTTNMLQLTSATQTISASDNRSGQLVNVINGSPVIGTPGYLWPNWTRGFAIGGGATILTTTNGSVSGSKITVNYNTFLANATGSGTNSLCLELWRTGGSEFYARTFNQVRSFYSNIATPGFVEDVFQVVGTQGSLFTGNLGNVASRTITGNNISSYTWYDVGGGDYGWETYAFGLNSQLLIASNDFTSTPPIFTTRALGTTANTRTSGSKIPFYNQYGVWQTGHNDGSSIILPTVVVGEGGRIAAIHGRQYLYTVGAYAFENSNTLSDLYDIYGDKNPSNYQDAAGVTWNLAACGSGGTILYNSRSYNAAGNVIATTGWTLASTPTVQALNSIASNYGATTTANVWVSVGNNGTVLRSTAPQGPWLLSNSVPTNEDLYGVSHAQGYWVAVGDRGTIIYSTDGDNWLGPIANPADGFTSNIAARNLKSVAGGIAAGSFVVCGEEIIMASNTTNPANGFKANIYLGGSSVSSTLTRLQYYGSNANVANNTPTDTPVFGNQVNGGTYTDIDYVAGEEITYYLVVGDMTNNNRVVVSNPFMTVTEFKR